VGNRMRPSVAHLIISLVLGLAAGLLALPSLALAVTVPGLHVPSATLVTADGTVVFSRNADAPRRVASTIKLLNALVARDSSATLDTVITVSKKAVIWDGGVGLRAGQKLTVRQLLNIMLIHSANDAAEALAIGIAGSEKKYVARMNAKAIELGLGHTCAADPHGLGKRETCSAADLAVIARHVMTDPVLRDIVHQTHVRVPRGKGKYATYSTTDQLLGSYRGMEGIKTGYTDPAGYCFVGAAKRGGIELFGVVLGAHGAGDRFSQMRVLLDYGFAHTSRARIASADQTMGVVAVTAGQGLAVTVHPKKSLDLVQFDATSPVITQVSLPPSVKAPVKAGQRLGAVQAVRDGKVVASVPLVADRAIAAAPPPPGPLAAAGASAGMTVALLWQRIMGMWAGIGRALGI
jgi:serine-type D-Ala-D-Ala carboxypeptidase (penicillin-binding protein 5/6)